MTNKPIKAYYFTDVVLCGDRHRFENSLGEIIEGSVFPQKCPLVISELNEIARSYLKKYSDQLPKAPKNSEHALNVYVTGFAPALVALVNIKNTEFKSLKVVLQHYDPYTKSYVPQVIL